MIEFDNELDDMDEDDDEFGPLPMSGMILIEGQEVYNYLVGVNLPDAMETINRDAKNISNYLIKASGYLVDFSNTAMLEMAPGPNNTILHGKLTFWLFTHPFPKKAKFRPNPHMIVPLNFTQPNTKGPTILTKLEYDLILEEGYLVGIQLSGSVH